MVSAALLPDIIVLATFKGGSGKSTLAACLAVYWHFSGCSPALVDADPQGSILDWHDRSGMLGSLCVERYPIEQGSIFVHRLVESHRPVIIDTAGFRHQATVEALSIARLALIPVKPSPMDVSIALHTRHLVDDINRTPGRVGHPVAIRFVLTMTTPGSVIARHIRSQLVQARLPLLSSEIANRVSYPEAALLGQTPTVTEPRGAAAREIAKLASELEGLVPQQRTTNCGGS